MRTIADIIASFRATAAELEAAIAPTPGCSTVASHNWIVLDQYGQPCLFDVQHWAGKKFKATVIGKTLPNRANRWERDSAETLAKAVNGSAVFWQDATAAKAAEYRAHIELLEKEDA
jgi:hypothetical protein